MEVVRQFDRRHRAAVWQDVAVHVNETRNVVGLHAPPSRRREEVDRHLGTVRNIGVFRALGLGDLLCATPALRALKRRFPQARITLISLPWAQALASRLESVDGFIAFPGHPLLPERQPDVQAWPGFLEATRAQCFDLLLQLHGSGGITNGLVTQWGARHVAAFHEPDRTPPDALLGVPWPTQGTEPQRLMTLISGLGEPDTRPGDVREPRWQQDLQLDFPLLLQDVEQARALLGRHGLMPSQPYVCMHAGSQLPSRRWPVARFAEVAQALMAAGQTVVLTGVPSEADIGHALMGSLPADLRDQGRCINLIGQTTLWTLGALIQDARLLICNDTGVSHVAAALGAPSVVVSCGAEVARWAPADVQQHQLLWADRPCRPCAHAVCPFGHECALDVTVATVRGAAMERLSAQP